MVTVLLKVETGGDIFPLPVRYPPKMKRVAWTCCVILRCHCADCNSVLCFN